VPFIILNYVLCFCQAGLFSAVAAAFIVQIIPQLQPNPADLTNTLLLRILEQNTTFGGTDPLALTSSVPTSTVVNYPTYVLGGAMIIIILVRMVAAVTAKGKA